MSCERNRLKEEFFFMQEEQPEQSQPVQAREYKFFAKENLQEWAPIISLVLTIILVLRNN